MSLTGGNTTNISMDQSENEACGFALMLAAGSVLPMVLKAAVELDLLELIKKAGPNASPSASELAEQLPAKNPDAATTIDRFLRLLSAHAIVTCTIKTLPDGCVESCYSLSPMANKFLTKNENGVSLAPLCLLLQDKILMEGWYHLKDEVLDGGVPFNRAHGMSVFEYSAIDPRFNQVFNTAMSQQSTVFMSKIIEVYKGFEGLESLVDVGGGIGTTIHMIKSKYPSIQGINFDLPHVVTNAPSYPGVEHIGGDMFVNVPSAEAILLKCICHDWSDTHCNKFLKNCYEALPNGGKVIISELLYPEDPDDKQNRQHVAIFDVLMHTHNPGGKERTETEFRALAKKAGFTEFKKVCSALNYWIMELYK